MVRNTGLILILPRFVTILFGGIISTRDRVRKALAVGRRGAHTPRLQRPEEDAMRGLAGFSLSLIALSLALTSCDMAASQSPPDYNAILAQPDRTAADKQNDQRRHMAQLLPFTGCRPGMKELDMAADAGYSTELMARCVAPNGTVYAQNAPGMPQRVMDTFNARMKTPAMKNAVLDAQAFDNPIPAGVSNLDLVTFLFGYHDTTYLPVDRAKMDKAMFDALKSGGTLVVTDYAAAPGAPVTTGKQFHRLDEAIEKREIEAAGFKLIDEANFLRAPGDTHDFIIFNAKVPIDIYVLKFQKP
jgi:predicted methyltransferase